MLQLSASEQSQNMTDADIDFSPVSRTVFDAAGTAISGISLLHLHRSHVKAYFGKGAGMALTSAP
jgi:hypothetical protein